MVEYVDIVIIGAGILGCFAARAFSAYDLKTIVLEKREDVCTMISKGNTGIVYAGYDMHPGSLKANLTVKSNSEFEDLCNELGVPFYRCGSLMISYGPNGDRSLEKKLEHGRQNGVPNLKMISGEEAQKMEPNLKQGITKALYAETTGVVNPWELGIAAFENARSNGVSFRFMEEVKSCEASEDGILLKTTSDNGHSDKEHTYVAKYVINCAGSDASTVRELLFPKTIGIHHTRANYLVYEQGKERTVSRVVFYEPEQKDKALTLAPTLDRHLIIGATESESDDQPTYATDREDLERLLSFTRDILPEMDASTLLNQFGSARPNPYLYDDPSAHLSDFNIAEDDRMISLIGIKTPGITCAYELGKLVADKIIERIGEVKENSNYDPIRIPPEPFSVLRYNSAVDGPIICACNLVTERMIRDAVKRGATTINGIRRRTSAGMGRCQGAECEEAIIKILADELEISIQEVTKDGTGSTIII
ncbi:MAG: FAD-dependent oxidoreductase [Lachnospiraceae bacterium]|nr:FAD-dependent oxidoreductase [Lachnospiraceae bacterium]